MVTSGTNLWEALVGIAAVATLPAGILAALFFGVFEAAIVFVVGWLLLVPVLGILSDALGEPSGGAGENEIEAAVKRRVAESIDDGGGTPTADRGSDEDPLETLRERYARGEVNDVEFERKLERLIETEDVEVPDGVSLDTETDDDRERDPAFER